MSRPAVGSLPPAQDAEVLRERARRLARPPPPASPARTDAQLLVFELGDRRYAVDLARVDAVIAARDVVPLPLVPDFVVGVMNRRGRLVPLIDVRPLLAGSRAGAPAVGVVIGSDDAFALAADAIAGVESAPDDGLTDAGEDAPAFLRGVTRDWVAVIDVGSLAADPRLVVERELRRG